MYIDIGANNDSEIQWTNEKHCDKYYKQTKNTATNIINKRKHCDKYYKQTKNTATNIINKRKTLRQIL